MEFFANRIMKDEIKSTKILVTDGAGFIGINFVKKCKYMNTLFLLLIFLITGMRPNIIKRTDL
jgi:hypothetical protein